MPKVTANAVAISIDRIFLDLTNPRHDPYSSEAEVIDYLCRNEYVYALARDIARIGLNPLELFALLPSDGRTKRSRTSGPFIVAEGNRRMCAIKLLNDPDLAPAKFRKEFKILSDSAQLPSEVLAVVFDEADEVSEWLERIHGGPLGGIGRKAWNPEQKTRHLGDRKNVLAQSMLDYAEQRGLISAAQRKGKLTTAQRYLGNAFVREALGIENADPKDVSRNRPVEEFDLLLGRFMRDLVDNTVNSRSNSDGIKEYSRILGSTDGVSGKRVPAAFLSAPTTARRNKRLLKEPKKPQTITYEPAIGEALEKFGNYKLQKLYFSISDIPLERHTPLVSVGVWAFLETLTAYCGRDPKTSFPDYLNSNKLSALGFVQRDQRNPISQSLTRISTYGNTTKHHDTSANFHGEQLSNDVDTLKEVILKMIEEAK